MIMLFNLFCADAKDNSNNLIPPAPSIKMFFYTQELNKIDHYLSKKPYLRDQCNRHLNEGFMRIFQKDKEFFRRCVHVTVAKNQLHFINEQQRKIEVQEIKLVAEEYTQIEYELKREFLKKYNQTV